MVSPCRVWRMSQNSARIPWKEAELQKMLSDIMDGIRDRCADMVESPTASSTTSG